MHYDGLERLTSFERHVVANGASVSNETFTLDAASNIASRTGPTASYSYDGANRPTSDGTRFFTWDGADRLRARGADTFSYDALGRMTASVVGGTTRSYTYDGDGLLRSRIQGSATTSFLYDPSTNPAPLMVAGTERIVYGLGPLYRVHANGSYDTFVRDGLGSVRLEVSEMGAITTAFDYAAYGKLNASSGAPLLGFAGELTDPSGLIYLRARWYDPGLGRFTVPDRFVGAATEPHSLNLYTYAAANPANKTDPNGNCIFCILGGALIGGIANTAGYVASLAFTHQDFAWDQAAIAFGTGAVAGAVCTATLFGVCAFTNAAAAVVQYGLAPGQKSLEGYAAAAIVGIATSPLVFTPFKAPIGDGSRFIYSLTRIRWAEGDLIRSGLASFLRSLVASGIAGGATTVFGAEQTLGPGVTVGNGAPLSK